MRPSSGPIKRNNATSAAIISASATNTVAVPTRSSVEPPRLVAATSAYTPRATNNPSAFLITASLRNDNNRRGEDAAPCGLSLEGRDLDSQQHSAEQIQRRDDHEAVRERLASVQSQAPEGRALARRQPGSRHGLRGRALCAER